MVHLPTYAAPAGAARAWGLSPCWAETRSRAINSGGRIAIDLLVRLCARRDAGICSGVAALPTSLLCMPPLWA